MKAPDALLKLLKQQYTEANNDLQRRLPKWIALYYAWRGLFQGQDEDSAPVAGSSAQSLEGLEADVGATYEDNPEDTPIYVREVFRTCETYLSYLEEAFTAPPKPFQLALPRVWKQPPASPEEFMSKKKAIYGASEHLVQDYRLNGSLDAHKAAFRDIVIFGAGYDFHREADSTDPYPRAVIERIKPWMYLPDPFSESVKDARYGIVDRRYTVNEAKDLWSDQEKEIEDFVNAADDDAGAELDSLSDKERSEVRVLEYWSWLSPKLLKELKDDLEDYQDYEHKSRVLMRIYVLADGDGPSEYILGEPSRKIYSHGEIPIQEHVILRSPTEQGPRGIGVADLVLDDGAAINSYFNHLFTVMAYQDLLGGLVDSAAFPELQDQLSQGFKPGEWKPVNLSGRKPEEVMYPLAKLYSGQSLSDTMQVLQALYMNPARTTGVNDQTSGLSTKTFSNTAAEADLLAQMGSRKFKMAAGGLDKSYRRSITLYAATSGDALKGAQKVSGQVLWYLDEQDQFWAIDPTAFDEQWEVRVMAGSTWISDQGKATELLQLAGMAKQVGELQSAAAAIRKVAYLRGLEPGDVAPSTQEIQTQQQQAMMMQQMMAALQQGGLPQAPGAPQLPGPVQPGGPAPIVQPAPLVGLQGGNPGMPL